MKSRPSPNQLKSRQAGLSLLEVLIAMALFSIGILGIAGLQVAGLKSSNDTHLRTQAEFLASDILDRIRANRPNATDYTIGLNQAAPTGSANIAQIDLREWKTQISSDLPAGQGGLTVDNDRVNLTIRWEAKNNQNNGNPIIENLQMSAQL